MMYFRIVIVKYNLIGWLRVQIGINTTREGTQETCEIVITSHMRVASFRHMQKLIDHACGQLYCKSGEYCP